jgi:hypothetical protein
LNRLVLHPDLYAALPPPVKKRLTARLLRPGGSPWIRQLVEGNVRITESRVVTDLTPENAALHIRLDDGSERTADQLIVATGYRFELDRLAFLGSRLMAQIQVRDGWPVLDRYFRSTQPAVTFVGYPAEGRFGPISRFVLGAAFTAERAAAALRAA